MKCSEVIKELGEMITKHGDLDLGVMCNWDGNLSTYIKDIEYWEKYEMEEHFDINEEAIILRIK